MYVKGLGVPQDYKTAVKWYRLAAEQGDADAQTNLGYMYEKGQGVPKNYKTAAKWYKLSADQGETTGMSNLGELYYLGKGVSPNLDKAFDLLKEAALKGNLYSVALLLRIWEVDMSIPYKLKYNFYVGGHKKQFYISVNPYFPNVHTRHVNLSMKPLTITVSTNNDHVKLKFTKKQMMEATQNAVSIVNKKLQETIKLAKPTRDDRGRWGLHFNTHISQLKNCEITANVTSVFEEIVKAKDNLTKFFCKVTDEYGDKLERYAFGDDDGFVFQITTYIDGYTSATYIETHEILSKNYKVLYTPKGAHYEKMLENRAVPYSLYENNKDNKKPKYIFLHLTGSDIWVSYFDKKSGEQIKSKIIPTSKIKKRRRL